MECDNLQSISHGIQEYGLHTTQAILDYRHKIGDCMVNCGGIQKECREQILYFMNKAGNILDVK